MTDKYKPDLFEVTVVVCTCAFTVLIILAILCFTGNFK